jgi:FixJ family two-component response regulator
MKAGAVEFLSKPFGEQELLQAIDAAIARDRTARQKRSELAELQRHYNLLTPREREVLPFVVAGCANKVTAADLGTSEITIGVHRGQIMRKMGARSLAELVRMADTLGITRRLAVSNPSLNKHIIASLRPRCYRRAQSGDVIRWW